MRPLSNGGCDVPENIVICHRDTNEEKKRIYFHTGWQTKNAFMRVA
ncbi:MAG: hypothetical protein L6V84_08085 [Oscillospiraceae bacterium]|nr:MAG: hypothetical protein L6V84_08085 [Oscillospiraceae bacterium]